VRNHLISVALSFIIALTSAPDSVRISLEAESAKWFTRLSISGGVVALGCLLELWETTIALKNWFRARRGLEVIENPRNWGIPIAALGLLLVIGGVAAEVIYEGLSSQTDAKIRSHESDVLSIAETTAGAATERAGKADAIATENEKEAEQLRKDAEAEHLARMQLEKSLAWRTISPTAGKTTLAKLSRLPQRGIQLYTYEQSPEASNFSKQVLTLVTRSGWPMYFVPVLYLGQGVEVPNGDCFWSTIRIDAKAAKDFRDAMRPTIPDLSRCESPPRFTAGTVIRNTNLPHSPRDGSDFFMLVIGVKAED
jgi:hypothetical protein